jgi:hypothetical protein
MERYTLEDYEVYRKEQDEKAAKAEQERREYVERESARQAWVRDGGAEADFQRVWPRLRDEGRQRRKPHLGSEEVTQMVSQRI